VDFVIADNETGFSRNQCRETFLDVRQPDDMLSPNKTPRPKDGVAALICFSRRRQAAKGRTPKENKVVP